MKTLTHLMHFILPVFLLLTLHWAGNAQPVRIDTTFGVAGQVRTDVNGLINYPNQALLQPDGKIIVIGLSTEGDFGEFAVFTIVRYNTDGSLDHTFGTNGKVTTSIYGRDVASAGALQGDGKIIVAGYTFSEMTYEFVLTRYNADGSLDTTFGTAGVVITDVENRYDYAEKVFLQPDGRILVAGWTRHRIFTDGLPTFARYNPDGSLDTDFGFGGVAKVDIDEFGWHARMPLAALQPDGKVVSVGYIRVTNPVPGGVREKLIAVRLNADGTLDDSFGDAGIAITETDPFVTPSSLASTNNGELFVLYSGRPEQYVAGDYFITKLTETGSVDSTFGANGVVNLKINGNRHIANSLILQDNQKILVSGRTTESNNEPVETFVARFSPDGTLDKSFATSGEFTVPFFNDWYGSNGVLIALQDDKKIVLAGSLPPVGNSLTDFGLMRLEVDASLPVTLVSFQARQQENQVVLGWTTAAEISSADFEVQHSTDGKKWTVIGTLPSRHNSNINIDYAFTHAQPKAGQNFYRLKMNDLDGSFAHSAITTVNVRKTSLRVFSTYPNPTAGLLQFHRNNIRQVQVFDSRGTEYRKVERKGQQLDLSHLPDGIYTIIIRDKEGHKETHRVVLAK